MGNTFKVNTDSLRSYANSLDRTNMKLADLDIKLDRIYKTINYKGLQSVASADYRISYSMTLKRCSNALKNIADDFERCERNAVNFEGRHFGHISSGIPRFISNIISSDMKWSLIGSAGYMGDIISAFHTASSGEKDGKWVIKNAKSIVGLAEDYYSCIGTDALDWRKWVGLSGKKVGFKKAFSDSIWSKKVVANTPGSVDIKDINAANKSSFLSNLGNVLTVGEELYENWGENKDKKRAILETVGESAVKIGLSALAAGVFGAFGAPAIVAGGITVGAMWALDEMCKKWTEKNTGEAKEFDEFVSDTIIDGASEVVKQVGNVARVMDYGIKRQIGVKWKTAICGI